MMASSTKVASGENEHGALLVLHNDTSLPSYFSSPIWVQYTYNRHKKVGFRVAG
jgi:hypothetical protein